MKLVWVIIQDVDTLIEKIYHTNLQPILVSKFTCKSRKISHINTTWMNNKVLDFQQYVTSNIIRSFICNMKRPSVKQSMKYKWFGRCTYFGWWTPPPLNWEWISRRPLHQIIFMTDRPHPLLQLTIDPCKTNTPSNFHDRLTPTPPPICHISMEDHYTSSVSHVA